MSVYFNEVEANAEIIKNLIREVRRLTPMALLQLNDGRVIRTENYEVLTQEDLQAELDRLTEKSNEISALIAPATTEAPAEVVATEATPTEAAPADAAPAEATADAAPAEATATADVVTPDVTPVETVAAPVEAATDIAAPADPPLTLN